MPNFTATTAEELRGVGQPKAVPPVGPPACPTEFLANMADGVAVQFYLFPAPKGHTVRDLVRPNYFARVRETLAQQLTAGARVFIFAILGERSDGSTTCWLEVIEAKMDPEHPVIVAKGRTEHFTPVRHDGDAEEDETPKGGKAKAA